MVDVVLVGCGFMGRMHATVYKILEAEGLCRLVGVVDTDTGRLEPFAQEFGVPGFASTEEAPEHHAVDLCLPTYLHARETIAAASRGKHVLCEKPMALTTEEAQSMIDACDKAGVRLMIAHCIRFWPEYALLKEIIEDRRYGELLSIDMNRYGQFPSWSWQNWLADEAKAGGAALDMHIHDTDFARYILGEPDSMTSRGTQDKHGVSQIFTTMQFGRIVAQIQGGWNLPPSTPFKMAFRAIFEDAAIVFDGPMTIYQADQEPIMPEFEVREVAGGGNISSLGGYLPEIVEFLRCVEAGENSTRCTPESSRDSLALCLREIELAKA